MQNYGLTSHPPKGAEALLVALGGQRQHAVVIAVEDRRYRVTDLGEGEVALYTMENGEDGAHRVHLKEGRIVELHAGGSSIVMTPQGIRLQAGNGAHIELDANIAGDGGRIEWG